MDGDAASACQLVVEKERFREFERAAGDHRMRQILAGRAESAETSGMFLDIVRDLKRIESHIAATVYRLLERSANCAAVGFPDGFPIAARPRNATSKTAERWTLVLTEIQMFNTRQAFEQSASWEE
ncbi:MAG: hypothetical protein J0J15_23265 [Mesorhizobium sp.]|mgnify:CR=1 FL=1|nr:hypothetical protein [Mesorhizobium sp.]